MNDASVWVAVAGLTVSLLAMGAKLVAFMREIQMELRRIRHDRKSIACIPLMEYRIRMLERHTGLTMPTVPDLPEEKTEI